MTNIYVTGAIIKLWEMSTATGGDRRSKAHEMPPPPTPGETLHLYTRYCNSIGHLISTGDLNSEAISSNIIAEYTPRF
jgi:hypothetical protein